MGGMGIGVVHVLPKSGREAGGERKVTGLRALQLGDTGACGEDML